MHTLAKLVENIVSYHSDSPIKIEGLTTDATRCKKNDLYIACLSETSNLSQTGIFFDGRKHIDTAIANGAVAVLTTPDVKTSSTEVAWITHEDPLTVLGQLCQKFYPPPYPKFLSAITGTNGKTSCVSFASQIWQHLHLKGVSIGNLGTNFGLQHHLYDAQDNLSLPDTISLHRMLSELAENEYQYVAMEATSHALNQYRLHHLPINAAAFTNLTHEHLDFHGTMEHYLETKLRLFNDVLLDEGSAVICIDGPYASQAIQSCQQRQISYVTYGENDSDFKLVSFKPKAGGSIVKLSIFGKPYTVTLKLLSHFQAINILCAMAIVHASGITIEKIITVLGKVEPIPGRFELKAHCPKTGAPIFIDYAHTPDGLKTLLESARLLCQGRIITVFSANSNKDKSKRPDMGQIVSTYSDIGIVTTGIEGNENASDIRSEILSKLKSRNMYDVANREDAIALGLETLSSSNDMLIIAGMGTRTFNNGTRDETLLKNALARLN